MLKKYDAVVIGAGLGGLSVATLLARKGFSVCLLERHNVPGGYATSFVRGRYEFEVALHELSDIGTAENPGFLRKYLDYIGITEKVEFVELPDMYRSVFPDLDLRLPKGREAYEYTLTNAFPDEADGIHRFLDRVFSLAKEVDALGDLQTVGFPEMLPKLGVLPFKLRSIPRYLFSKWEDVLARDVKDPKARAVISQYWGYFGMAPADVSFFYFAIALATYIRHGGTHVRGRSQALASAFVERMTELGADVRMGCGVARIMTSDGKVTGVITECGEEILADVVVSNADPITTSREMVGLGNLPPGSMDKYSHCEVAGSSFNVYMGVAKTLDDFGCHDHEIFLNADYDQNAHAEKMKVLEPPDGMVATCYNAAMPDISPPGTSMIVLTALMYADPWTTLPPAQYVATKTRIADRMIDNAEAILPGLREATETIEVSTPLTNMRYAGTLGGSIYGFNPTPFNHTILRPSAKGPLGGLYYVGAWVQPGGGYSPAMTSGQIAGQMIALAFSRKNRKG